MSALPEVFTEPKRQPFIILPSGTVTITEAADQIFELIGNARGLFYRGGRVHEVATCSNGAHRLDPISPAQFRSRLEAYCRPMAWRTGANGETVMKPTVCAEETARALLESLPARERLPNVSVMSACPVLANTERGPVLLGAGWHQLGGGLYITGGESPQNVSLSDAVRDLVGLLSDFDFTTPGDHARALASLVGPALRFGGWLASPLPVDVGEADSSQSGKTYRQKIVAAIYRETCNVVVQRAGGVGGIDESISQKLIDGRPFVLLDNLRGKLDSPFLEAVLTAPGTMPARVPHRGEVQIDPRGFAFQITSNGVETTRDLANRASIVRIRKRPAGFIFREFPEGDLHAHVVANQAYYLGCVFAVIREWVRQGKQRTNESRHDFREWAQTLDWIGQKILGTVPLLEGHNDARERVSDPRRIWLRALCLALREAGRTGSIEHSASNLAEFTIECGVLPPGTREHAEAMDVSRKIGTVLGAAFGQADLLEVDGFKVHRVWRTNPDTRNSEKAYRFE